EQNEKQGTNKNIKRKIEATTEEKREIRIVYESQNAEDAKKNKTTVKIVIDEEQLTKGAMSTLKYAGIPIKKRRKEEKEGEEQTRIVAFRAELPEANFKIIRNQKEQTDDYLTWPILLHLNHKREICNAEMVIENK
ncbi:hypothetical protein, partial [Acinetobacter baumannii]|uniref:hypothetical protein n=1 Tax=Acinetobacter baumannii TaxID=470 RepID=UPI00339235E8